MNAVVPRTSPAVFCLLVACNDVAGIDSTPCAPGCVDERTRLFCDNRGEAQTQTCPPSISECAEPACSRGECSFAPVTGKPCGRRSGGICSDGFACIGPHTKLSANHHHTCLAGEDGKLWCWGENAAHELGDGTADDRGSPVPVRDLPGDAIDVSAGYAHTCALLREGAIACWGSNEHGQCGTGSGPEPQKRPELVPVPEVRFAALTAGRAHTCAVSSEGDVYCWGDTTYGQAGVDPKVAGNSIVTPTKVESLDGVEQVETVKDHTCATRLAKPFLLCWGSNVYREAADDYIVHKLGPGADGLTYSSRPVPVEFAFPAADVGMGPESTYAKTQQNWVFAWGLNTRRQLGVTNEDAIVPTPSQVMMQGLTGLEPLLDVEQVLRSAGFGQCASVHDAHNFNSSVFCWGENDQGELGLGEAAGALDVQTPAPVRILPTRSRQLVRGEDHVCAITDEDGLEKVQCYGAAHLVGNGTTRSGDPSVAIRSQATPLRWNPEHLRTVLE
jgi:alpha-tubulin suppressor-like RCC1 family protein